MSALDQADTYPFRSHRTMAQVMADEAAGEFRPSMDRSFMLDGPRWNAVHEQILVAGVVAASQAPSRDP